MQKIRITVIINNTFWNNKKQVKEIANTLAFSTLKTAYPSVNSNEYSSSIIISNLLPFSDGYDTKTMKSSYKKHQAESKTQILLFQSIYDIHPKIKKAVRYILELQNIGYKIYIFSLNPQKDFSEYCTDYLNYHGIYDAIDRRNRHEKYNKYLLDFAVDLRRGDPVTYSTIKKYTGIPKSTLISYMNRNGIISDTHTGRNRLYDNELTRLKELYEGGFIISPEK